MTDAADREMLYDTVRRFATEYIALMSRPGTRRASFRANSIARRQNWACWA